LILGFDKIYVASNDCRDGTDHLLNALDQAGYISHVPNVLNPGDFPQRSGYIKIREKHDIDSAEWLMVLDADEFLNVHVGENKVADLTACAKPEIDIIALFGMFFTSYPEVNWRPGRVCELFPERTALNHAANRNIKTLTRHPSRFQYIRNHHVLGYKYDVPLQVLWGCGSQTQLDMKLSLWEQLRTAQVKANSHHLAHYNHYGIKTYDSFRLRRERGRGAMPVNTEENARHTDQYFKKHNKPKAVDRKIFRYGQGVEALMAEMLQDQEIRRKQLACEQLYAKLTARFRR
jgi:Glycosyl transferase family 2